MNCDLDLLSQKFWEQGLGIRLLVTLRGVLRQPGQPGMWAGIYISTWVGHTQVDIFPLSLLPSLLVSSYKSVWTRIPAPEPDTSNSHRLPRVGWLGVTAQVGWNPLGKMAGIPGIYLCATLPTQV